MCRKLGSDGAIAVKFFLCYLGCLDMNTIDLEVSGVRCGSCVSHVTQALQPLAGVGRVEVDLQSDHVRVSGELPQESGPFLAALTSAGYPVKLAASFSSNAQPEVLKCAGIRNKGGCCG